MRVRIQWMLAVALAIVLVAQVPASATAPENPASPPTGSSQPTNKACGAKPLSDPPLWEQSLPLATESPALSASDPGCVREVGRSASSVVWQNPNRTLSTRMFSSPVNYQASDGSWQAIDTRLVPDGKGGIVNKAGPFSVDLASSAADPSLVHMAVGDASLSFGFDGALSSGGSGTNLRPAAVSGSVGGDAQDTVTYADALANVDVRFQVLAQELKEAIVLNRPLATDVSPQFAFTIAMTGMSARTADDGTIEFVDSKSSKVVFTIPQGLAVDASGDMTEQRLPATTAVSVSLVAGADASVATLVESVDPAWLADPARVYPVTIDPSLTMAGSGDAYISQANTSLDCTGSCQLSGGHYYDWVGYLFGSVRSLIKYPVSALDGTDIISATWHGDMGSVGGTTPVVTTLHPISSSWTPTSVNWLTQPTVRTDTATVSSTSTGWRTADITSWMQNWTATSSPWDQDGIRLEGPSGTMIEMYGSQDPTNPTYIDATFDAYPTLSNFTAGGRYLPGTVNNSTPQLSAQINDTDNGVGLSGNFQLWDSTHTTMLQSGSSPSEVSNGQNTTWTPTSLSDGTYTWRADGFDGTATSDWSAWQTLTVDTTAPVAPTCSWDGGTQNGWHTQYTTNDLLFSESPSSDAQQFEWGLDVGDNPTNLVDASSGAADATLPPNTLTDGWHDLACRTIDAAGNISAVTHWTFGVGADGGFLTPVTDFQTQANVTVQVNSITTYDGIALEWRRADTDGWTPVSAADVTCGCGTIAWPLTATPGTSHTAFPSLVWDVASNVGTDGPVQLNVVFYSSGAPVRDIGDANSVPNLRLNQDDLGSGSASTAAGPGDVNLLTGNLELSANDVALAGGSVSRTFDSRNQAATGSVFGPGWTSNISTGSSSFTSLTEDGTAVIVHSGTEELDFSQLTHTSYPYTYDAQDGSTDYTLTKTSSTEFSLEYLSEQTTLFDYQSGSTAGLFVPTTVADSFSGQTSTITWTGGASLTYPTRIVAPAPVGVSCISTPFATEGCKTLSFVYASSTTATGTGSSQWGNYIGQLQTVQYTAWNPDLSTPAMQTVSVATYLYDNTGRLRAAWDPRISPGLKTTYDYDSNGHIASLTPPGLNAWSFSYAPLSGEAASTGRLATVSRSVPTYAGVQTPITTFVYRIPLTTSSGGAYNMDPTTTANWGQQDNPADATAVFPADQLPSGSPPSSYTRATVYYIDAEGALVNVAQPGGEISTTERDAVGNTIRTLSPNNRVAALGVGSASTDHAAASRLLDSQTVYDGTDTNVTDTYGPAHTVTLPDGTSRDARQHVNDIYDQSVPSALVADEPFNLLTTQTESAAPIDGSAEQDTRTTTNKYDVSGDNTGWELATPLQTIVDPGSSPHLNLTTTTKYDLNTGQITARVLPANPSGGDAHETDFVTYTAGTNPTDSACSNQPDWAGLACRQGPAAQPGTSGLPKISTTYTTKYNLYGQPEETKDEDTTTTPATVRRTTDIGYDAAGRQTNQSVSSSVGTAVDTITTAYDTATGQPYTTTDATLSLTITRTYDAIGQPSTYEDADSKTSTYTYDQLGNIHSIDDGKGTTTYTYDTSIDPRGLLTSISDSEVMTGSWSALYDADGNIDAETYPGSYSALRLYDSVGEPTLLVYYETSCLFCSGPNDWPGFVTTYNVHGEKLTDQGISEGYAYQYDGDGRLTTTNDQQLFGCTKRTYGFDADTNRTSLNVVSGAALFSTCPVSGSGTTTTYTYDGADRITDSGTSYDALGRTTALPVSDSPSGHATTLSYYANDLVHSMTANGTTNTYNLDPDMRAHSWSDGTNTHTNHYTADSDSPAWTIENTAGTTWSRNINAFDGLAATIDQSGDVTLQLANLHGDIFSTVTATETDWLNGILASPASVTLTRTDEYGVTPPNLVTGTTGTRYDYLGTDQRQRDTMSGLQLMGRRVYNSTTGRFLQADPILGGSSNTYGYTNGDPVNQTDLGGTQTKIGGWFPIFWSPLFGTGHARINFQGCGSHWWDNSICAHAYVQFDHAASNEFAACTKWSFGFCGPFLGAIFGGLIGSALGALDGGIAGWIVGALAGMVAGAIFDPGSVIRQHTGGTYWNPYSTANYQVKVERIASWGDWITWGTW